METAIVLTPNTHQELQEKISALENTLGDMEYEVIAIMNKAPDTGLEYSLNLTFLDTCNTELDTTSKQCIARYCINKDTKYLLFLDMDKTISKVELERRIKFLEVEQLIGVVGDKVEVKDEFIQKTITHKLLALLTLNKEEFDARCCDEEGKIKCVNPGTLLTTVKMWDKIGGFPVVSADSYLEYCARVQALGYTIFPLTS